jgi:hypothetical protein
MPLHYVFRGLKDDIEQYGPCSASRREIIEHGQALLARGEVDQATLIWRTPAAPKLASLRQEQSAKYTSRGSLPGYNLAADYSRIGDLPRCLFSCLWDRVRSGGNKQSDFESFFVSRQSQNFSTIMPATMSAIAIKKVTASIRSDFICSCPPIPLRWSDLGNLACYLYLGRPYRGGKMKCQPTSSVLSRPEKCNQT